MTDKNLIVSIILPTYNRQELLRRAIQSVVSQSFQDWELIVWDDGSTDNTRDVVMGFIDSRISYFFGENKGAAAARNQAIAKAKGEYLAFLDSDDVWSEDKLAIQMDALHAHPEIDFVFSDFENKNLVQNRSGNNFLGYRQALQLLKTTDLGKGLLGIEAGFLESLASGNYIGTDTIVMKRNIIHLYGGFNESLRISEDFELWWRLGLKAVQMAYHDQVLMTRYKPQGSLTSLNLESTSSALKALDICTEEAIAENRADLVNSLRVAYRNAWQNMITACTIENDKQWMMTAFKNSLKYGFRLGSVRLLIEGLAKIGLTR